MIELRRDDDIIGSGARLWENRYLPGACPERRPKVVGRTGDVRYPERKDDDPSFLVLTQYRYTNQWFEDGVGASEENGLDRGLYFYRASGMALILQEDSYE